MKNLFLDDLRMPIEAKNLVQPQFNKLYLDEDWAIVRNYKEFTNWISFYGVPDLVSFDHDLADFQQSSSDQSVVEKTGLDCAKWLVDYCLDNELSLPDYIVHSANPVGKKNIEGYLSNATKHLF